MQFPTMQQRGVSLVEMMVATTLSIIIGAGVIQIFSSNKNTYRVQEAVSRLQENGRFAMDFLAKDLRMAGFVGCSGNVRVFNNVDYNKNHGTAVNYSDQVESGLTSSTGPVLNELDSLASLQGFSYTSGALPAALTSVGLTAGSNLGDLVENTDVILIKRASSCPGSNVTNHNNANNNTANMTIEDNSVCQIQQNDIVMVSNCQTADIFGISNVPLTTAGSVATLAHGANWNTNPKLYNSYAAGGNIFKMRNDIYYIGVGRSGQPALFRRDLSQLASTGGFTSVELVEGIEDMTLIYGEDMDATGDGVADKYVAAAAVTNWDKVVAIRVQLSARTIEDNIAANIDNTWNDKRIRRIFTSTAAIRNRTAG